MRAIAPCILSVAVAVLASCSHPPPPLDYIEQSGTCIDENNLGICYIVRSERSSGKFSPVCAVLWLGTSFDCTVANTRSVDQWRLVVDGRRVAFRSGKGEIYIIKRDGSVSEVQFKKGSAQEVLRGLVKPGVAISESDLWKRIIVPQVVEPVTTQKALQR